MSTEYAKIKKAVELEKNKKIQGEARIHSLQEEQTRILNDISKEIGRTISTKEEVTQISSEMKSDIESKIIELKEILDAEGVSY